MYNDTYEEYIRSILGYPNYSRLHQPVNFHTNSQIEACYPEIYKIIYPMVKKACTEISEPITPELIDRMTNEIYSAVESDNQINVRINLTNEVSKNETNRSNRIADKNEKVNEKASEATNKENREDRQFRNRNLLDLIKILIIRELLNRPIGKPNPGRPPFPPIQPRPPMRPRMENRYYDLYEY